MVLGIRKLEIMVMKESNGNGGGDLEVTEESEGWQTVRSRKRSNGQRCAFNENNNKTSLSKETQVVVLVANQVSAKEVQSNRNGGDSEISPLMRSRERRRRILMKKTGQTRETVQTQLPIEFDVTEQVHPKQS